MPQNNQYDCYGFQVINVVASFLLCCECVHIEICSLGQQTEHAISFNIELFLACHAPRVRLRWLRIKPHFNQAVLTMGHFRKGPLRKRPSA